MIDDYLTKQIKKDIETMKAKDFDIVTALARIEDARRIIREIDYHNLIDREEWQEVLTTLLRWEEIAQNKLRIKV